MAMRTHAGLHRLCLRRMEVMEKCMFELFAIFVK